MPISLRVVVFAVSGGKTYGELFFEVELAVYIGCPGGVFEIRHYSDPFKQVGAEVPFGVFYDA